MINVTEIVIAVIGLLTTIITVVVVPLLKTKLTDAKQQELATWVRIAVAAAEQIFSETEAGRQKKEYVIKWLESQGVDITDPKISTQIDALIEAFVAELNNKAKAA